MKLGVDIPLSHIEALENRAHRLASAVDAATLASGKRHIRDAGGQIIDRILEWVDEIKDLREIGDEDIVDRMQSFLSRLRLAEQAVKSWPRPGAKRRARKKASRAA